jgi:hypothetical protein
MRSTHIIDYKSWFYIDLRNEKNVELGHVKKYLCINLYVANYKL